MTVVRYKNRPAGHVFNNTVDHFFSQMPSLNKEQERTGTPVNIKENDKEFILEVMAQGFAKEEFKISLEENLLSITGEKIQKQEEGVKVVQSEYLTKSFKRSFTLNESIEADNISAKYENGILTLNLLKKAPVKPEVKKISIL